MLDLRNICKFLLLLLLNVCVILTASMSAYAQPRALSIAVSGRDVANVFKIEKNEKSVQAVRRCAANSMDLGIYYLEADWSAANIDWADANALQKLVQKYRGSAIEQTGCVMQVGRAGNSFYMIFGESGALDACQQSGSNCFQRAEAWAKFQPLMFSDDTAQRPVEFGSRKLLANAALAAETAVRKQRETVEKAKQSADNERNSKENAKRAKLQAFVDTHRAIGWLNSDRAAKNPFLFEGKTLIIKTTLESFTSKDTAYFQMGGSSPPFICTGISGQSYEETGWVMMAVKVLGTGAFDFLGSKVPVPRVKYVAHIKCNSKWCEDFGDTFIPKP